MQGPYVDCSKPFKKTTVCHECDKRFKKGEEKDVIEIYDDPFAVQPRIIAVHSDNEDEHGTCLDKMTDTSWADFRYQECPVCERLVCSSNGWRSYFKPYGDEEICIRCYQEKILEHGHPEESFDGDRIPGDFFNQSSLSAHGWTRVPGFHGFFVNGKETTSVFCAHALKMIYKGHRVLVDYNSMGIGGSEGYVSLYVKA